MRGSPAGRIQLLFACVLAVAFFLPVAEHMGHLNADGESVRDFPFLVEGGEAVEIYTYLWEDEVLLVPVIFFLPLALTLIQTKEFSPVVSLVFEIATPLASVGLLLLLNGIVAATTMFFGRTAYGGYLALASIIGFILAATAHGVVSARRRLREAADLTAA